MTQQHGRSHIPNPWVLCCATADYSSYVSVLLFFRLCHVPLQSKVKAALEGQQDIVAQGLAQAAPSVGEYMSYAACQHTTLVWGSTKLWVLTKRSPTYTSVLTNFDYLFQLFVTPCLALPAAPNNTPPASSPPTAQLVDMPPSSPSAPSPLPSFLP